METALRFVSLKSIIDPLGVAATDVTSNLVRNSIHHNAIPPSSQAMAETTPFRGADTAPVSQSKKKIPLQLTGIRRILEGIFWDASPSEQPDFAGIEPTLTFQAY